tara:strand:+ start:538 stop:807 length:270 start_codon:yes stop_codon:yes gene_type:complete
MPDITVTITDIEKKSLDYICVGISTFTDNWLTNRARKAKEEIIALNTAHCNANSVAIAVGEAAQIDQAYSLGVIKTAEQRAIDAAAESK